MARGWGWGYVKARTPSCTRLITFWFISKLLGFVFPNTSNLKPLHLSCLAGMCAAWLPVFHSCPLVPTPCLCHLRPELNLLLVGHLLGGGDWHSFSQDHGEQVRRSAQVWPWVRSSLSDIEDGTLSVRLPSVFNAIVVFEGTLPYGYWFA